MARILIVEDDEDLLHLMSEYLESAGLEHDLAVSAEQARNLLKHSGYDIVVSDYNMPGESGFDLLRYVSSMYPETPFVLWTGSDDPRIKRESMGLGVHTYIQKPFYMNELRQTIINLVRRDDQKEVPAA
jgi:two-component system, OmpR family, phosphate regulon response regulator OmpR